MGKNNVKTLGAIRSELDSLDQQIISLLVKRMSSAHDLVECKVKNALPLRHKDRENEIVQLRRKQAAKSGLDPDFAERMMKLLMNHSLALQKKILLKRKKA
ncbi:MAG: chorismate mutase [Nanoarchaeota archaeon]